MSTTNFLRKVLSLASSLVVDAIASAVKSAGNLTLPTVYLKRDVVNVKLKRVQIETSDGIGVGRQLKIRIAGIREVMYDPALDTTGFGTLAYPPARILSPEEVKTVNASTSDADLFFMTARPVPELVHPRTEDPDDFRLVIQVNIDEDDPTYDDHSSFTFTHYIPYQNKAVYTTGFSIAHFTSFYEGPVRKDVGVKFSFDFEFALIQAMDEIEIMIYHLRNEINSAAARFSDVSAGFVAAMIYEEVYRRDIVDDWQDGSKPSILMEQVLINRSAEVGAFVGRTKLPDIETTLGFGQISIQGVKSRVEQGHLNASDIPGYSENPDEAAMKFLIDPRTAPLAVAATVHHLIAFINKENGGSWDARDYPQAVAHFYNGGPSTLTGEILQNPQNGLEKVARIDRLTKIINLE